MGNPFRGVVAKAQKVDTKKKQGGAVGDEKNQKPVVPPYRGSEDRSQQRAKGISLAGGNRTGGYPPVSNPGGVDLVPGTMDYRQKVPPWQPRTQGSIAGPSRLNAALQGNGGFNTQVWTPGYQNEYDRNRVPAFKGVRAFGEYRPSQENITNAQWQSAIDAESLKQPTGGTPYLRGSIPWALPVPEGGRPNSKAWQNSLDYQDASVRDQTLRKSINSFSGIPRFIGQSVNEIDTAMSRVSDAYKDPYGKLEQIRLNRGEPTTMLVPAYEGPQQTAGGGGGGGDGGGYGGYGGGGGGWGGGYDQKLPPWYYGLSTWRI